MAPGQIVTRVSRIPPSTAVGSDEGAPPTTGDGLRALAQPAHVDKAAAAFARGYVDVIGYASTSTGYAIGSDAEATLVDRLAQQSGRPAVGTSLAASAALHVLEVRRVALVHPPWFDEDLNDLGTAYFRSQGFDVISATSADLVDDPTRIEPDAVVEWVSHHVSDTAEAVFIGGTGFRASRAIEALEERLGRPVLESNQVLLWAILAAVDADLEVRGYGQLFGQAPGDPPARP